MQTLQRRSNAFNVEDESQTGDRKRSTADDKNSKMPSASKLLAEKRPLTSEEQASIVSESENSLMLNDRIATTSFTLIIAAEGFVFFFFAVADFRTYLFRTQANEMDVAIKTGRGGGGSGEYQLDTLCEAFSHCVVCILALRAAYKTNKKRSLRKIVVHKILSPAAALVNSNSRRKALDIIQNGSRSSRSRSASRRGSMIVTSEPPPPLLPLPTATPAFPFPPPPLGLVEMEVPRVPFSSSATSLLPPPPPPPPPPSFRGNSLLESVTSPDARRGGGGSGGGRRDDNISNNANDDAFNHAYDNSNYDNDEGDDDSPSISIELHDENIRVVQTTHRKTAILSLCLVAPLIILSTLLSSSGESLFALRRLLLCLWQPLQHLVMAWAATALVEDVVTSLAQLKKARYNYQDA